MAAIYKRGNGQWEAAIRRKGYPTQRMTWGSKAKAEEWAREVESAMDAGTFQDVRKTRGMTLGDVIDDYKKTVAPRLKNESEQSRIADVLKKEFGRYGLLNLPPEEIAQYRDRLKKEGLGASTINHHINTLSAIYTAAVKDFHYKVPINPVKAVSRLTPPPPRRQRMSDAVVKLLISANKVSNKIRVEKGGRPPFEEFESFLRLALCSAMRRGEIAGLQWKYVDFDRRVATLPDTKNGTSRDVPLSSEAIGILRALNNKRKPDQDRVFTLTAEGFKTAYRRAREHVAKAKPEVKRIRFHDARREATSRMAKKLPNVVELSKVTGHKKLDMLKIYYEPDPTELARKLDQGELNFDQAELNLE